MKTREVRVRDRAEGLVLILVILAILGGGVWYLYSSRRHTEKEAWNYAREVAEHIALHAMRVSLTSTSRAKLRLKCLPLPRADFDKAWRIRSAVETDQHDGQCSVYFVFLEPRGSFRAEVSFPAGELISIWLSPPAMDRGGSMRESDLESGAVDVLRRLGRAEIIYPGIVSSPRFFFIAGRWRQR